MQIFYLKTKSGYPSSNLIFPRPKFWLPHMFYDIIYVIAVSNSVANHLSHTYFSLLFQKVIGEIYNRKLSNSNEQVWIIFTTSKKDMYTYKLMVKMHYVNYVQCQMLKIMQVLNMVLFISNMLRKNTWLDNTGSIFGWSHILK